MVGNACATFCSADQQCQRFCPPYSSILAGADRHRPRRSPGALRRRQQHRALALPRGRLPRRPPLLAVHGRAERVHPRVPRRDDQPQGRAGGRAEARVHRDRLPPRPRPVPRASPAAPPPSSAALAAPPPRSAGREPPSFRCPVASGSPAAASRRPTVAAACNSAPTLSIAPDAPRTLETISSLQVSAVAD